MTTQMRLQMAASSEFLMTQLTLVVSFTCVFKHVSFKIYMLIKSCVTQMALVRFIVHVSLYVSHEIA